MKEFFREVTAARERAEDRAKDATFQAWQTARFYLQGRSKKGMPKLSDAMNEIGRRRVEPQSAAQMQAMLTLIGLKPMQAANG